jgi:hypothetical protein
MKGTTISLYKATEDQNLNFNELFSEEEFNSFRNDLTDQNSDIVTKLKSYKFAIGGYKQSWEHPNPSKIEQQIKNEHSFTEVDTFLTAESTELSKKITTCFLLFALASSVQYELKASIKNKLYAEVQNLMTLISPSEKLNIPNSTLLTLLSMELVTVHQSKPEVIRPLAATRDHVSPIVYSAFIKHTLVDYGCFSHWISGNLDTFNTFKAVAEKFQLANDGIDSFTWEFYMECLNNYVKNHMSSEPNTELDVIFSELLSFASKASITYQKPRVSFFGHSIAEQRFNSVARRHKALLHHPDNFKYDNDYYLKQLYAYISNIVSSISSTERKQEFFDNLIDSENSLMKFLLLSPKANRCMRSLVVDKMIAEYSPEFKHFLDTILEGDEENEEDQKLFEQSDADTNIINLILENAELTSEVVADFAKAKGNKEKLTQTLFGLTDKVELAIYLRQALKKDNGTLLSQVYYTPRGGDYASPSSGQLKKLKLKLRAIEKELTAEYANSEENEWLKDKARESRISRLSTASLRPSVTPNDESGISVTRLSSSLGNLLSSDRNSTTRKSELEAHLDTHGL